MTLKDNLERACELAYEFYTGKCFHLYPLNLVCDKCGERWNTGVKQNLATSLDAWRPIWDTMWHKDGIPLDKQKVSFVRYATELASCCGAVIGKLPDDDDGLNLGNIIQMDSAYFIATATELHHLEAALRAAEVECDRCEGTGKKVYIDAITRCPLCTNGRISLYQQLERECDMNEDAKYQARLVAEDR